MNDRILFDPGICHGKPVIRGTRTPVAIIVGSLAAWKELEEVQREYDLTIQDIRAAVKRAREWYASLASCPHRFLLAPNRKTFTIPS